MDVAEFEAAWAAGGSLSVDEAIAEGVDFHPSAGHMAVHRPALEETRGGLSPRELDVLRRLVAGASNREIADALYISPRTVQGHLASIFGKLGVGTRAATVSMSFRAFAGVPTPIVSPREISLQPKAIRSAATAATWAGATAPS